MLFIRKWDGSKEYLRWESNGIFTVEDLNPEHDEQAVELMITVYLKEEVLCERSGFSRDKELSDGCAQFWKELALERVSLACYRHHDEGKQLVAVNMCTVKYLDEPDEEFPEDFRPELRNFLAALNYISNLSDYKKLGITEYLAGCGLVVIPQYRGAGIGRRVVEARKPMCRMLGIPASGTIFSAVASQKLATRAGFKTALDISFRQLSDAGFHFPGDPDVVLKNMYIKYE